MTLEQTQQALIGDWTSITPEVRPSAAKNPDGTLKPFYLERDFRALPGDRFELAILNFGDPYGKVPLARLLIKGHVLWRGEHPIAAAAQKVDFVPTAACQPRPDRRAAHPAARLIRETVAPWRRESVVNVHDGT